MWHYRGSRKHPSLQGSHSADYTQVAAAPVSGPRLSRYKCTLPSSCQITNFEREDGQATQSYDKTKGSRPASLENTQVNWQSFHLRAAGISGQGALWRRLEWSFLNYSAISLVVRDKISYFLLNEIKLNRIKKEEIGEYTEQSKSNYYSWKFSFTRAQVRL